MWLHLLKKEILNRKLHFLPNESRLTCRSSDITKHSHTAAHCVLQILHSSWSLFPQQVTYIEKILKKWYASAPLPPLPIQPNNLFSGKLLHPLHYQLHFAISKGNNSLQRVQLQRGDLFLFMIFSICSFNFWSA